MQAADFLQDEALLGSVVRALSHAFVPEPTAKKRERFIKPWRRGLPVISYLPSGKQRARACKIVQALPPHLLLSILSAADPTPDADAMFTECTDAAWNQLIFLLLLLPPACHPAVLKGRLPDLTTSRRLSVPELPEHPALDDTAPARASLLVQVLSAAAVLAGGQPHRIWDPDATPTTPPHLQLAPHGIPLSMLVPRKRRRDATQPGMPAAGGAGEQAAALPVSPAALAPAAPHDSRAALTSLKLKISSSAIPGQPSSSAPHLARSFGAISQLKTLCELELRAQFTDRMPMCPHPKRPEKLIFDPTIRQAQQLLVATLQALPALSRLDLKTSDPPFGPRALHAASVLLGISAVTQLVSLSLPDCIDCNAEPWLELPQQAELEAVLSLSRLTRLTHLRLDDIHMNTRWAATFAQVMESLVALQTLDLVRTTQHASEDEWLKEQGVTTTERGRVSAGGYGSQFSGDGWSSSDVSMPADSDSAEISDGTGVSVGSFSSDGQAFGGPLVLHVCRSTALTALRSLDAAGTYAARPADYLRCLAAVKGGALRQLTALQLQSCCFGRSDAAALGSMLTHLSDLQTLNLAENVFRDAGMAAVAGALPQMTALTALDVGATLATCAGALLVLEAAGEVAEGGVGGLRRLALAEISLQADAAAIAEQLGRLEGLEELVLYESDLEGEGLVAVVGALQPLPALRLLDISGYGPALAAVPLLAQATALRQVEIERRDSKDAFDVEFGSFEDAQAAGAPPEIPLKGAILAAAPWLAVLEQSTYRQHERYEYW